MDMQGNPVPAGHRGGKNTSDAAANQPVVESTGILAADSLAADSSRAGGAFAANANSTPSGVPGSKSTLANTDTSAATELPPAQDAHTREGLEPSDQAGAAGSKYPEALGGQPHFPGSTHPSGYAGGPSTSSTTHTHVSSSGPTNSSTSETGAASRTTAASASATTSSNAPSAGSTAESAQSSAPNNESVHVDAAPQYVQNVVAGSGDSKPKGANLTEGGFEGEPRNNDYEIGSKRDPGRAAVQKAEAANAQIAGSAAPLQRNLDGNTPYDALGSSEQA